MSAPIRERSLRALVVLAVGAGLATLPLACSGGLGPGPALDFRVVDQTMEVQEEDASATVEGGTVVIGGVLETPTPCWDVAGSVESDGGLHLRVSAREEDVDGCVQALAYTRYEARIGSVSSGEHRVVVVHRVGGREAETILETTVTVP